MRNVLHLANDGDAKTVCGQQIFLVSDYATTTDHVDCARCKRTKAFAAWDPRRFTVDVWNHEGDVVHHERDCTADRVDEIHQEYDDRDGLSVVVAEE